MVKTIYKGKVYVYMFSDSSFGFFLFRYVSSINNLPWSHHKSMSQTLRRKSARRTESTFQICFCFRENWIITVRRKLRNCCCSIHLCFVHVSLDFFLYFCLSKFGWFVNLLPHLSRRSFYKSLEASTQPNLPNKLWLWLRVSLRNCHQRCRYWSVYIFMLCTNICVDG